MTTRRKVNKKTLALVSIMCLVVGACGSDDGDSADTTDGPPVTAGETTQTSAPGSTGNEPATGEPVVFYSIQTENESMGVTAEDLKLGVRAAVERVNSSGGLGGSGRPIEVVFCADQLDPNVTADCARKALEESVANLADTACSAPIAPTLAESDHAMIGSLLCAESDFAAPNIFTTNAAVPGYAIGTAALMNDVIQGENIGWFDYGMASSDFLLDLLEGALEHYGLPPIAQHVQVSPTQTDMTAAAAQLADMDVIAIAVGGPTLIQLAKALRQQGSDAVIALAPGYAPPAVIEGLGETGDGSYNIGWYAANNSAAAGNDQMLADLTAAGASDTQLENDFVKMGWLAVELANQALEGVTDFTPASILEAMKQTSHFDTGGVLPILDYTTPGPNTDLPRAVAWNVYITQIESNHLVAVGDGSAVPLPVID